MAELIAQFNASIRSGVAPMTVNFTNTSTGAYSSVAWDFGDGGNSTLINPSYQYLNDGVYTVTLTIYDELSESNQSQTTISVYPDIDSSTASTTQQALFTTKRFLPGQVNVAKEVNSTSEFESQVPMVDATGMPTSSGVYQMTIDLSTLTGTKTCTYTVNGNGGFNGEVTRFELIPGGDNFEGWLFLMVGDTGTTRTAGGEWYNIFDYATDMNQVLKYKIVSRDIGTNELTLDRSVPDLTGEVGEWAALAIASSKTGTTYNYFNLATAKRTMFMYQSLDQLNTLDATGLNYASGVTKGTNTMLGINSLSGGSYAQSFVWGEYYEDMEKFSPGTIYWSIPWIMWHKGSGFGIQLTDSYDSTMVDTVSGLKYRYLRDAATSDGNIVGKVFYDKKLCVITDQELNAALQHTSNRSYTLPEPFISVNSTTAGVSNTGATYWVTYRIREDGTALDAGTSHGLIDLEPIHCRYIKKLNPANTTTQYMMTAEASKYYAAASDDFTGFTVGNVDVIIGTGATTAIAPDPDSFMYSAMSPTYGYSDLQAGLVLPDYADMSLSYDLSEWSVSGTTDLSYGHEYVSVSYLSGNQESTIYKMATTCVAKNNEFNTTQNSTFDESNNESVYITEVGLFNENNELLMTGKLNDPIEKNDQKYVTIKLELDL